MSNSIAWASERESRTGSYRGITFEILRWHSLNKDGTPSESEHYLGRTWMWNSYIFIPREQIPERLHAEFDRVPDPSIFPSGWRHYEAPVVISDLEWHGGLTFFDKLGGADGMPAIFKAGCDYQHYWDEGHSYDWDQVAWDIRATIDSLWEAITDLGLRCQYTGKYVPATHGFFDRNGTFYSFDGARKHAGIEPFETVSA